MGGVVISGTGVFTPPNAVSNEQLVESYNAYAENWNRDNAGAIGSGDVEEKQPSSVPFIVKASTLFH